jgi:hypothetical protein
MEAGKTKAKSIKDSPCGNASGPSAFIEAREEVENAYDALLALEREFQCAAYGQMSRRHPGDNKLLQSLNMECVNFLARQNMVTSPQWRSAWQRFEQAVIAAELLTQAMRGDIVIVEKTTITVRKSSKKSASKSD